jgi:asparagine synthase (glutamine-hydrolysing)
MSPLEVAWGYVAGGTLPAEPAVPSAARQPSSRTPVEALEDALRPALRRHPCLIEFSGGRDSSLVLAIAVRLARREGLPEPVAFTQRFPGIPETDETEWQELVVAHLGVTEWERVSITDEVDLLGPVSQRSLLRHGVVWPATAHTRGALLVRAAGGAVVTGEGGDEVFGPRRLTPLRALQARKVPFNPHTLRYVALALAPQPVRRRAMQGMYQRTLGVTWLREEALSALTRALAADAAAEPMEWRRAVRRHLRTRTVRSGLATLDSLAREADVASFHPLLDTAFVDALCRAGGRSGYLDRTATLRALFGDHLPEAVLTRTTKATFGRAAFNEYSRAFVAQWNGDGIDGDLVDVDALRAVWRAEVPHGMSYALLQASWLAAQGGDGGPTPTTP